MMAPHDYHTMLYPLDHPRLAGLRGLDARAFGKAVRQVTEADKMIRGWEGLISQPFHGLTCDGKCRGDLFTMQDEGAPTEAMVRAAGALLGCLDGSERQRLSYPIDAREWRMWSNPEFLINDNGLRLEDLELPKRQAILAVIAASTSEYGFNKARDCMRMNAFLGELCDLPLLMNEWSYNFLLFGTPSTKEPWGWALFGHHLVLNCFVLGNQMVMSPTFMGAEPNVIDRGPHAGTTLFIDEERLGLGLMNSLTSDLQARATTFVNMNDPTMPEGRWHPGDQRHLGGAFQDNRVVPYEGVSLTHFSRSQRETVLEIASHFLVYLPEQPRAQRLRSLEDHINETWWSWIGRHGDDDPFYYRIQSPVLMLEFDHHSGVWLSNQEPAKCHIHTVVRTPNGNDYGRDLLRQHYAKVHPGRAPGSEF